MTSTKDHQSFLCLDASPGQMDRLWAEGWRHFGILFFRYTTAMHAARRFTILPLRIDLRRFVMSRSQKRVISKNLDTTTILRPTFVDEAKEDLFLRHRMRFKENVPASLDEFLSPVPDTVPCVNRELCVYHEDRLIGVTFLDFGQTATSAVYAVFDPAEAKRSVGILMMLHSIRISSERGYRYYYPGYAYREPFSSYDYKKNFAALEFLDWNRGWRAYDREAPCVKGK